MRYLILCIFFLCAVVTYAQKSISQPDKEIIDLYAQTASVVNNAFQKNNPGNGSCLLIKVRRIYNSAFKKQFHSQIRRQINTNWFIVDADSETIQKSKQVELIFNANNLWKYSPALLYNQSLLQQNKLMVFLIEVNNDTVFLQFIDSFKSSATIVSLQKDANLFRIKATAAFIKEQLINRSEVASIDLKLNNPREETVINDHDNTVNATNLFFASYPNIKGDGLTVSVKENLFDTTDIDFTGRYKPTTLGSTERTSHATTMATLIGGGGNSFFTGKGIAWGCNISSSNFANLLPESNADYQQYGISVQNHSYGVGIENFYGSDAGAYDASMIANPSLLHIFSAGNSGNLAPTDGQYKDLPGFANLTGSFKMAKNIITVGSVDSFYNVPLLSSKGPAYDGRIKPELVAYGNDGSSGAAAITSGTALAVQSAYSQQHSGLLPANTLVKAILINSADDVFTKGPDFYSGYGNVNTYKAVKDMLAENFFADSLQQTETKDFSITVPANAKILKITLVWNDAPAQTNAFTALVNDLDLQLEQTNNHTTWLPWVLNSAPNTDSLNQLPTRKRDSLNVVEQITIDDPQPGNYIIHVKGFDVASGSQPFYIAYRWDTLNTFQFTSPAKEDHFTSGGNSIFRWASTYDSSVTGKLEYKFNNNNNWQVVNENIDLSKKYYQWNAPDTFAIALARMTIGAETYISDTFDFSKQLYPKTGFSCTDSVLIYWNKAPGINQYKIERLGHQYLEPVTVVSDTSAVIHTTANSNPYIAVTTVFDALHNGVNSYTFNYNEQGVACYISNFLADINANKNALLQLVLGSTYNVATVQFQELTVTGWVSIKTIQPVNNTAITYEDATLHNGSNTYRALVTLSNGSVLFSATASVYYFGNNTFVMYPNPVRQYQSLTILSNNFLTNTLFIYDITGRKVMEKQIINLQENISVAKLAKGMYIVVILNNNEKLFTGKLFIQ
ncbi:MAG TPA: S8 family serine peptidase [Panacibacter sp.]|nr:S8 family serine peptidase [Panacibacter sp.]